MPNFPISLDTDSSLFVAVNNLRTQLTSNISNSELTIPVITTSGFPTSGFLTLLSDPVDITQAEAIRYNGLTTTTFSATERGAAGTPASPHFAGDNVDLTVVADHHNELKDAVIELEHFVGVSGSENLVKDINGLQGTVTIAGSGKTTIQTVGQTITVSGQPDDADVDSVNGLQGTVVLSGINGTSIHVSGQQVLVSGADAVTSLNGLQDDVQVTGAGSVSVTTVGQTITVSGISSGTSLTVRESDGTPSVSNVNTIVVTTGTLTDNGGGQVTIQTGGGGGSSGTLQFSGALVTLSGADQTIPNNTLTPVDLNQVIYDTDSFFNASNSSLVIPSGLSIDYVLLRGRVVWRPSSVVPSFRAIVLIKNGDRFGLSGGAPEVLMPATSGVSFIHEVVSHPLAVAEGDEFTMEVQHNIGSSLDLNGTEALQRTSLSVQVIGYTP